MLDLNNPISKYGFKNTKEKIFPSMVFVEITNVCNLRCIHCPYSWISQQKFYSPRHMDFGVFKKITDEASKFNGIIFRLVCDGEPMMHPDFLKMIKYAKQKEISPLCLNTNGTLLDEKASREILGHGVDVIEISLDALQKDTYERVRSGANYDQVISNVRRFIKMRNALRSKTKIMVSIIDQPEVKDEIEEFKTYWAGKVDRVIIRTYTSIGGLVNPAKMKSEDKERWPCPLLWTRIFINVGGLIKFCVEDWLDQTVVWDLKEITISQAWDSIWYQKIRENHLARKFYNIPYCKDCIDWTARRWDYDYFFAIKQLLSSQ